ncbi:hypothetical protein [Treponema zioleckii]|uniref:hypothetical protein n=1 Tax=Treponema zioleckii TaxID=331680 RepID=UPI00168A78B4|nr:hypothetical protein [Treponema zioleckii]
MQILAELQKEVCRKISEILSDENPSAFCVPDFPLFIFFGETHFPNKNDKLDSIDFSTLAKKIQSVSINAFENARKTESETEIYLQAEVGIKNDEDEILRTNGKICLARIFTDSPETFVPVKSFLDEFELSKINLPVFKVARIEMESEFSAANTDNAVFQKKWRILQEKWQKPRK